VVKHQVIVDHSPVIAPDRVSLKTGAGGSKMEKLMNYTLEGCMGYTENWRALQARHVVCGCKSFLVLSETCGQYQEPPEDAVVTLDDDHVVHIEYDFSSWLYSGRKIEAKEIAKEVCASLGNPNVSIYLLESLGLGGGAICEKADIFLDGKPVQKVYLKDMPEILGVEGLFFYTAKIIS